MHQRIIFCSGTPYFPSYAGAAKANRIVAEHLAQRGHEVHILSLARAAMASGQRRADFMQALDQRGISSVSEGDAVRYETNGVQVCAADGFLHLEKVLKRELEAFRPDRVFVSSEDFRQTLLATSLDAGFPVVYQARTITSFPVGPFSAESRPQGKQLLQRAAATVSPCQFYADYLHQYADISPRVIYNPFRVRAGVDRLGSVTNEFVTMVNPCALKGISLFLDIVDALPGVRFAAVPTWGTGADDLRALSERPNVTLLPAADDIRDIFRRTRVLLAPSLWPEGIANVVVEALLDGIPTMTTDIGGLKEAKCGTDFMFPGSPITRFSMSGGMPRALDIPQQDVEPWIKTLQRLIQEPDFYELHSRESQRAALASNLLKMDSVSEYEDLHLDEPDP